MKISVLVNGGARQADGVRARALFLDLAREHDVTFLYRDRGKRTSAVEFCRAMLRARADIVYVEQIGYPGVVGALAAKCLRGSRVIVGTGDPVATFARVHFSRPKAMLAAAVEWVAHHLADALVVVCGPIYKELLERQGYSNVHWIPGGVDTSLFRPLDVSQMRRRTGLDGRLVVGVVGSINWNRRRQFCYGAEIVEMLRLLKDRPIVGLIIGTGDGLPVLQRLAAEYGVQEQLILTGWVDHATLPQYINLMDVCVSTQSNDLLGRVRITNKVPEYLACGRYIIASDVGGASEFVREAGCLIPTNDLAEPEYIRRLADHLLEILADPSLLTRGMRGIRTAQEIFDYSVLRPRLREVIERVA